MHIDTALSPGVLPKYKQVYSASLGKVGFHVNSVYCLKYKV